MKLLVSAVLILPGLCFGQDLTQKQKNTLAATNSATVIFGAGTLLQDKKIEAKAKKLINSRRFIELDPSKRPMRGTTYNDQILKGEAATVFYYEQGTHYSKEIYLPGSKIETKTFSGSSQDIYDEINKLRKKIEPRGGKIAHLAAEDGKLLNAYRKAKAFKILSGVISLQSVVATTVVLMEAAKDADLKSKSRLDSDRENTHLIEKKVVTSGKVRNEHSTILKQ